MPEPGEYVALGAARQAAWALATQDGRPGLPHWERSAAVAADPTDPAAGAEVRAAYRALRESTHPETRA